MIDEPARAYIAKFSTALRRYNRRGSEDPAWVKIERIATEMTEMAGRLRGQANGTIPLPDPPDTPTPPESPSMVPSSLPFSADSEQRESADSEQRDSAGSDTRTRDSCASEHCQAIFSMKRTTAELDRWACTHTQTDCSTQSTMEID